MSDTLRTRIEERMAVFAIRRQWDDRIYDALRDVLKLHKERPNGTCAECLGYVSGTWGLTYETWPCSTVTAIARAIGMETLVMNGE